MQHSASYFTTKQRNLLNRLVEVTYFPPNSNYQMMQDHALMQKEEEQQPPHQGRQYRRPSCNSE